MPADFLRVYNVPWTSWKHENLRLTSFLDFDILHIKEVYIMRIGVIIVRRGIMYNILKEHYYENRGNYL